MNTKHSFESAGLIIVILIILAGGAYLWSQKSAPISDSPLMKKTYRSDKYGFEFQYFSGLTVVSKGPNREQKKIEAGEAISGTVQPSLETLSFVANDSNSEIFDLIVFPPRNIRSSIIPADYSNGYLGLGSACDRRWIDSEPHSVKLTRENNVDILAVGIADQFCYYLKNQSGDLIVFNKRSTGDVFTYFGDVMPTFRLEPPATSTTSNPTLNKSLPYPIPVIDSISPTSGPIGTEIKVYGKNMVDSRGGQNVAIANSKGEIAYFGFGFPTELFQNPIKNSGGKIEYVDKSSHPIDFSYFRVKVDSKICKSRGTDAALPCLSWMTITPGKYYIFIDHDNFQGHFQSNKIAFTLLS